MWGPVRHQISFAKPGPDRMLVPHCTRPKAAEQWLMEQMHVAETQDVPVTHGMR